jgi:hypothetical protein
MPVEFPAIPLEIHGYYRESHSVPTLLNYGDTGNPKVATAARIPQNKLVEFCTFLRKRVYNGFVESGTNETRLLILNDFYTTRQMVR